MSQIGGSVIWVAVLLALMLSLESLFKDDLRDGLIEQWLIGHRSVPLAVFAKVAAHWCTTGLALVLMAPIIAVTYALPWDLFAVLALSLLLGTPSILLIGAIGAAVNGYARAKWLAHHSCHLAVNNPYINIWRKYLGF